MALVKYVGGSPEVTVEGQKVKKGSSITVGTSLAASLLLQVGTWEAGDAATEELIPLTTGPGAKVVTQPLGGGGASEVTESAIVEWVTRLPICLPVSTTRWRLRIRNYKTLAATEEAGVAGCVMLGAYLGKPKWNEGRWTGALAGPPTLALGEMAVGTTLDSFSPWVTTSALQFVQYQTAALSVAWKTPVGKIFYDVSGSSFWAGPPGSNALVKASEAGTPALEVGLGTLFDVRLEYEYAPGATTGPRSLVGLVVGDSVSTGSTNGVDGGAYICYESWPAIAGLRQGHPIVNCGIGGASTGSMNVALTTNRYARMNLVTTVPDYAIVALGINDVFQGTGVVTLAQMKTNITAIVKRLQEAGTPSVYLATVTPGPFEAAKETVRQELNEYLREIPVGVQGVVDLDRQLARTKPTAFTEAAWKAMSSEMDPAFGTNVENVLHPKRAGYQRMAGALILP